MKHTTLPIPPRRCELINESGPRHSGSRLLLLPRLAIRIDHVAGLVLGRPQDQLLAAGAELLEVIGHDVLKLSEELARFRPLAVLAECDVPDHGLERVATDVGRELVVIGALGFFHRLGEHLAGRIAERHEAVAERIDALAGRFGLVALEQIGDAGELKRRSANEAFADDEAVGERTELHLDGCHQHADHGAAEPWKSISDS